MKNILLIGGPTNLPGIDRIDDDLLSILSEDHLYDRKAVIVWPTKSFLAPPADFKLLAKACNMNMKLVELVAVIEKNLVPRHEITADKYRELLPAIRKDVKAMDAALDISARSQAFALLSKLLLAISGGQNLVAVVSKSTPTNTMRWVNFPDWWSDAQGQEVKNYMSNEPEYGALNAVGDWPLVYHRSKLGSVRLGDLVPPSTFELEGQKIYYDANSYLGAENALTTEATVSLPVTDRLGGARAIKVAGDKGYMLVVPEPDKLRNFVIGLKTGGVKKAGAKGDGVGATKKKASASSEKYMTRKEVADELRCTERTVDRHLEAGNIKSTKVGGKVLILKSSVDKLLEG